MFIYNQTILQRSTSAYFGLKQNFGQDAKQVHDVLRRQIDELDFALVRRAWYERVQHLALMNLIAMSRKARTISIDRSNRLRQRPYTKRKKQLMSCCKISMTICKLKFAHTLSSSVPSRRLTKCETMPVCWCIGLEKKKKLKKNIYDNNRWNKFKIIIYSYVNFERTHSSGISWPLKLRQTSYSSPSNAHTAASGPL